VHRSDARKTTAGETCSRVELAGLRLTAKHASGGRR
jgi:hypothetical protein